jgi:hypothetical protein
MATSSAAAATEADKRPAEAPRAGQLVTNEEFYLTSYEASNRTRSAFMRGFNINYLEYRKLESAVMKILNENKIAGTEA